MSRDRPPLIRNATDPGQQGNADLLLRQQERVEHDDILWFMSHKQGRRLAWRILEKCGVHESVTGGVFDTGLQRVYYNAGQQDLGHWLESELAMVDEDAFFTMAREAMTRSKKFDVTVEAGRTESSAGPVTVALDGMVESQVDTEHE